MPPTLFPELKAVFRIRDCSEFENSTLYMYVHSVMWP